MSMRMLEACARPFEIDWSTKYEQYIQKVYGICKIRVLALAPIETEISPEADKLRLNSSPVRQSMDYEAI